MGVSAQVLLLSGDSPSITKLRFPESVGADTPVSRARLVFTGYLRP